MPFIALVKSVCPTYSRGALLMMEMGERGGEDICQKHKHVHYTEEARLGLSGSPVVHDGANI